MKKILSTLVLSLVATVMLLAQAPQTFSYQTVVRDNNWQVIQNQSIGVQVAIIEDIANGSIVYSEEHTSTTNNIGLINLAVGGGTVATGLFSNIDWGNHSYFMKISVDISGGSTYVAMGTTQLRSVPYALFAETSNNAGPQGIQGVAGNDGADGVDGIDGAVGATGPQGVAGNDGADGVDGIDGVVGATGGGWSEYIYWNSVTSEWSVGGSLADSNRVHIANNAGAVNQGSNAVAIGDNAGMSDQEDYAVAIGNKAGETNQGLLAVAIGRYSGRISQEYAAVAIGYKAGEVNQSDRAVAIGNEAGETYQGDNAVAIGRRAGKLDQGHRAIAIGEETGMTNQGYGAIAIGEDAGMTNQGDGAIAIGDKAGMTDQHNETIIINATGVALNSSSTNAFYVKPIRGVPHQLGIGVLHYEPITGEITYSTD